MTMVEDALRRRFDELTPEPPASSGPRADYRGPRRPSWVLPLAAAAVVLLVAALTVVISRSYRDRAAAPPGPTQPRPLPPSPPAGTKLVGYHGITVAVPVAFQVAPLVCSPPRVDAVVPDDGLVYYCPILPPVSPRLTIVSLGGFTDTRNWSAVRHFAVDSLPAVQAVAPGVSGTRRIVAIPSLDVVVSVSSPTPALAQRILATVAVAPVDGHGCQNRPPDLTAASNSVAASVLPTDGIAGVSSCVYTPDRQLIGSGTLTAAQLAVLRAEFAHARPGSSGSPAFDFVVRYFIHYGDGSFRTVEATTQDGQSVVHATDGHQHVSFDVSLYQRLPYSYG